MKEECERTPSLPSNITRFGDLCTCPAPAPNSYLWVEPVHSSWWAGALLPPVSGQNDKNRGFLKQCRQTRIRRRSHQTRNASSKAPPRPVVSSPRIHRRAIAVVLGAPARSTPTTRKKSSPVRVKPKPPDR